MNILFFIDRLRLNPDSGFGSGAEYVAYNLAMNLSSKGHKVVIFTTSDRNVIKKYENVTIYAFRKSFCIFNRNISINYIFKPLISRLNVDVVHLHAGSSPLEMVALLYAKTKRKPLVVTYHGDMIISADLMKTIPLLRVGFINYGLNNFLLQVMKSVLNHARIIISPSRNYIEKSRLLPFFRDKIRVIPNGINLEYFNISYPKEECRKRLGLAQDKKIILFLSAIIYTKGPDILLNAIAEVLKEDPNVQLILVGRGKMEEEIKQLINKLDINKSVITPGFINETEKALYYKAADIFVLPSRDDCLPTVILEAMACGTPIIATRVGGIPEMVEDGKEGLLVPPEDPHTLKDAILYLLKNEDLREKMAENAAKKVKRYIWKRIVEKIERIYEELVK